MARVAVLGLGLMGSAIAQNLLSKNHEVHVYNRTADKSRPLAEKGAIVHLTPIEAVDAADIVVTMLTDHEAVSDVALGRNGFLQGMRKGSIWIDMSTILPEASVAHAGECERRGIERLDAPVLGGPQPAARGQLVLVVGGRMDVYEKYLSFLQQLGTEVVYMGPAGAGHRVKLAFNLYLAILAAGFSEALTFAQKLGVSAEAFVEVVNKTHHKNFYTESKGAKVCKNDFTPTFTLKMMRKDLTLVQDASIMNAISLPVTASVLALYTAAMNQGLSELDYSAVVVALQRMNGVTK